jgi:hypothetical protein
MSERPRKVRATHNALRPIICRVRRSTMAPKRRPGRNRAHRVDGWLEAQVCGHHKGDFEHDEHQQCAEGDL